VRTGEEFPRFVTAYPEGGRPTRARPAQTRPWRGHGGLEPDGLEVEFVTASGGTAALLTLNTRDVRPVADDARREVDG
jgi:hypothetical protein